MKHDMQDILGLVRSGQLMDATRRIQENLGGDSAVQHEAAPDMKDITPRPTLLEGPLPPIQAKPKRTRPATVRTSGANGMTMHQGERPYRVFSPSVVRAGAPLIMMLHGCTQTPEDFAAGTRMNAAAEAAGAHVIWPEQTRSENANGCWTWFDPAHQGQGGEAAILSRIAQDVAARVSAGGGVHVAGLSAGGAMAAILATAYPGQFTSVGVHSGLPVGSAQDVMSAFAAMRSGGRAARIIPIPAIIFHGTADQTVATVNGETLAKAPKGADKPRQRKAEMAGRTVTVTRATGPKGGVLREYWEVDGLGHAWSGGSAAGSYADPAGPDATREMVRFFAEARAARG